MKTWVKILVGAGALAAAAGAGIYYYYRRQINLLKNELDFSLINIDVEKADIKQTVINVTLLVKSKSTIEAKVIYLYLDLYVDGQKMGFIENIKFKGRDGIVRDYFIIPAKGISEVPLRFEFSPKLVIGSAVTGILNYLKNQDTKISVIGSVKVQSAFLTVPVPIEYETSIKQILAPA